MTLLGIQDYGLPFTQSSACSAATVLAISSRCDRMLHDEGRGPQYRASVQNSDKMMESMLGFINNTVNADWEPNESILPVMHSITMQADQSVLKENTNAGWSVPRSVKVNYHQHKNETLLARQAITCLFLDYLYHSLDSTFHALHSEFFVLTLPSELRECFKKDNGVAVSEWIQRWGVVSWNNVVDLKIY